MRLDDSARGTDWDLLAEALNQYGIRHVTAARRPKGVPPSDPADLFDALARASSVRLQEAAIPLLLTHPQLASAAQAAIARLPDLQQDRAMRRYVAAAALQRMWRTRLCLAQGEHPLIPAAYLAELGLPPLKEDHGRATLWALAQQEEERYGYNAWAGYTSLMGLVLQEIALPGWGQGSRVGARARAG